MRKTLMPAVVDKSDDTHSRFLPAEEATLKDVGCAVAYAITSGNAGHVFAHNATMVIERKVMNENVGIKFLGSIYGHGTGYAGCVFGKDGLSPSITANSDGNTQPLVIDGGTKADVNEVKEMSEKRFFDIYNKKEIKNGVCITLTAHGNASPTTCGTVAVAEMEAGEKMSGRELKARVTYKGIRIYQNDEKQSTASEFGTIQKTDGVSNAVIAANPNYIIQNESAGESEEKRFYRQAMETLENNDCTEGDTINAFKQSVDKSGVCPTITTRPEGFKTAILPVVKGEIIQGGLQEHQHPRKDGISPSITAACGMGGGQTPIFTERCKTRYRIRKLTPRECGRLMGVRDSDIDRMAAVNSNCQLYKQFGNSIVVDVMCAMFRKLNIRGVERYV